MTVSITKFRIKNLGYTEVLHDAQKPTEIQHCPDEGCFVMPVNYSSSMEQILALIILSESCEQSIQVNPLFITFHMHEQ